VATEKKLGKVKLSLIVLMIIVIMAGIRDYGEPKEVAEERLKQQQLEQLDNENIVEVHNEDN
jgi:hypothetical protein